MSTHTLPQFEAHYHQYDHARSDPFWISGIYKIVYYEEDSDNKYQPSYRAYYKPEGWKNWGNHVNPQTPFYLTMNAAISVCHLHSRARLAQIEGKE